MGKRGSEAKRGGKNHTIDVDPSWVRLESNRPPPLAPGPNVPSLAKGPPPLPRQTIEVQMDWLEDLAAVANPALAVKPRGRRLPPPIPREDPDG